MELDFSFDYQLENDRVLLRPLTASDIEYLLPFALSEPDLWRFSAVSPAGKEGMEQYISQALAAREGTTEYPFIVFDKLTNQYAGSTRFYDIQPSNKVLQLGYTWYGQRFHATGLNKNCKLLLLQFAFDELEYERVEFRADKNNERSVAAMQSIGCVVEGVLRSNMPSAMGGRRNSIVLSILGNEWNEGVKERLAAKVNRLAKPQVVE